MPKHQFTCYYLIWRLTNAKRAVYLLRYLCKEGNHTFGRVVVSRYRVNHGYRAHQRVKAFKDACRGSWKRHRLLETAYDAFSF